jgi:hypothetical protein
MSTIAGFLLPPFSRSVPATAPNLVVPPEALHERFLALRLCHYPNSFAKAFLAFLISFEFNARLIRISRDAFQELSRLPPAISLNL